MSEVIPEGSVFNGAITLTRAARDDDPGIFSDLCEVVCGPLRRSTRNLAASGCKEAFYFVHGIFDRKDYSVVSGPEDLFAGWDDHIPVPQERPDDGA